MTATQPMTAAEHRAAAEGHLRVADNWRQYGGEGRDEHIRVATEAARAHIDLADAAEHQTH